MKKFILISICVITFLSLALPVFAFDPLDYSDNYQSEINRLKSLPVTEEITKQINLLIYYRIRKIATDFDIYEKYLTSDDITYMGGVDIACFSDKPALSNLKEKNAEWDKTGWTYDQKTQSWHKN